VKKTAIIVLLILLDIVIFIFFGLLLMDYEDAYVESKGAYFSLSSMTLDQKVIYISYQSWIFLHYILGLVLIIRFLKAKKDQ
jgi:hypothetical protein